KPLAPPVIKIRFACMVNPCRCACCCLLYANTGDLITPLAFALIEQLIDLLHQLGIVDLLVLNHRDSTHTDRHSDSFASYLAGLGELLPELSEALLQFLFRHTDHQRKFFAAITGY